MKPLGNYLEPNLIDSQRTINAAVETDRSHIVKTFLATVRNIDFVLIV